MNPPGSSPDPFVTCETAVGSSNGSGAPNPSRLGVIDEVVAADLQARQGVPDVARDLGRADEVESLRAGLEVVPVADPEPLDDQALALGVRSARGRSSTA